MNHNRGDVYLVLYPFQDKDEEKLRPAIIFHTRDNKSIVIQVTSHDEREEDPKDVSIKYWKEAGLDKPSVARCSISLPLSHDKIFRNIGKLHDEDLVDVLEKMYS